MADERRTAFPGLRGMCERRRALIEELVAERRAAGLTQTELAARMGTSQSAVARLERGDADVRLSTLERYAAALGRSVDWRLRQPESRQPESRHPESRRPEPRHPEPWNPEPRNHEEDQ